MRGYLHGYLHGRLFSTPEKEKRLNCFSSSGDCFWSRGLDSNQRPSGYEPDELPDCSTPQCRCLPIDYKQNRQERILHCADDASKPNHGNSRNIHKQLSKQPCLPPPADSGCDFCALLPKYASKIRSTWEEVLKRRPRPGANGNKAWFCGFMDTGWIARRRLDRRTHAGSRPFVPDISSAGKLPRCPSAVQSRAEYLARSVSRRMARRRPSQRRPHRHHRAAPFRIPEEPP